MNIPDDFICCFFHYSFPIIYDTSSYPAIVFSVRGLNNGSYARLGAIVYIN